MELYRIMGILIPTLSTTYLLFCFFNEAYRSPYPKWIYRILYCSMILVQGGVSFLQIPFLSLITFTVLTLCISQFAFESIDINKIVGTIMYMIYLVSIDIIIVPIYAHLTKITVSMTLDQGRSYLLTGIVSSIVGICSYKIVVRLLTKHQINLLSKSQEFFIVFLGFFELGAIHAISCLNNYQTQESNLIVIGLFLGFLFIDIYIILLFESISRNHELKTKAYILEQQDLMNRRNYEELEIQNKKYRKIMHDFKKHIHILQHSSMDTEYCQEILEMIDKQESRFQCSNPVLNTIINDRMIICENKGIELLVQMDDVNLNFMKKIDVATIFLNLIDNAIEACEEVEQLPKYIKIVIRELQNHLVVIVTNSCSQKQFILKEEHSTKTNHMGLGLSNVKSALLKYDTELVTELTNNEFCAKFILNLSDLI